MKPALVATVMMKHHLIIAVCADLNFPTSIIDHIQEGSQHAEDDVVLDQAYHSNSKSLDAWPIVFPMVSSNGNVLELSSSIVPFRFLIIIYDNVEKFVREIYDSFSFFLLLYHRH